ncbi:transposable element Tcb1 transposase [Trichonephila clavipes]|nr:transposable element Tcb1 transposase [Trichonephila clavipes]
MNKYVYLDILKRNLKQSASKLGICGYFKLYQGHYLGTVGYLGTRDILQIFASNGSSTTVLQSLKLLPKVQTLIPLNMCEMICSKNYEHQITIKQDLRKYLVEEWTKIDGSFCKKLIQSMPNRLREVIKGKEGPTRY